MTTPTPEDPAEPICAADFEEKLKDIFTKFQGNQKPLGADVEGIIFDNLEELYEK